MLGEAEFAVGLSLVAISLVKRLSGWLFKSSFQMSHLQKAQGASQDLDTDNKSRRHLPLRPLPNVDVTSIWCPGTWPWECCSRSTNSKTCPHSLRLPWRYQTRNQLLVWNNHNAAGLWNGYCPPLQTAVEASKILQGKCANHCLCSCWDVVDLIPRQAFSLLSSSQPLDTCGREHGAIRVMCLWLEGTNRCYTNSKDTGYGEWHGGLMRWKWTKEAETTPGDWHITNLIWCTPFEPRSSVLEVKFSCQYPLMTLWPCWVAWLQLLGYYQRGG
jgi:hypothetical protein